MTALYPKLVELGLLTAARSAEVDGQQLPLTVASVAAAYVMAANASAYGYCMLTSGAAHLIEAFGERRAQGALHDADVRRPLGRHDGADRAAAPAAASAICASARARPQPATT